MSFSRIITDIDGDCSVISTILWQVLLFLTDGKPNEPWGDEQYAAVKRQAAALGPNPTAPTSNPAQALTLTLKP